MDLTIVIPSWNGKGLLRPCLESVPAAAGKLQVETIVVDNGSTDGTSEMVRGEFPDVRLLRNERNLGFAVPVNQGVKDAKGRHVLVLNNDTRLTPGSLETIVEYMDATPRAGIVTPQLIHEDGRLQNSIANLPSLKEVFLGKSALRTLFPKRYPSKRQEFREPAEIESAVGAAMFVRREMIAEVGGLDERFFAYFEETDWCLRARKAGWKILLHPGAKVVHYQGRTAKRANAGKRIEYTRSLFAYFRKNCSARSPVLRVLYPFKNAAETLFLSIVFLLTLGLAGRARRKLVERSALLWWQVRGCPGGSGLRPRDA
ncbi:MAG: glycosyltransferase family 2 protein [Planctomycetota bacterium]|jgi:GT2 family glycosyltransferase